MTNYRTYSIRQNYDDKYRIVLIEKGGRVSYLMKDSSIRPFSWSISNHDQLTEVSCYNSIREAIQKLKEVFPKVKKVKNHAFDIDFI